MSAQPIDLGLGHDATPIVATAHYRRSDTPEGPVCDSVDESGICLHRHLYGFHVTHPDGKGGRCRSAIAVPMPTLPEQESPGDLWTLVSREPLTLAPSLLCRACGDHGFIREGRWVPA